MDNQVPRFASFKPKPQLPVTPRDLNDDSVEYRSKRPHQHRTRSRHEAHHNSVSHRRSRDQDSQDRFQDSAHYVGAKEQIRDNTDLFIVDRRGDTANVTYGTNLKHGIPDYSKPSERRTLGDSTSSRSDLYASPSLLSSLRSVRRSDLMLDVEPLAPSADIQESEDGLHRDFIPFHSSRKRGRPDPAELIRHRAIEQKQAASHLSDEPYNDPSDSQNSDENEFIDREDDGHLARQQHAALFQRTKEAPSSLESWLDYIAFQAKWVAQRPWGNEADLSAAERRSVAEVRISIYEDALGHILTEQHGREKLLLGLLKEGSRVWESKKLLERWKTLTKDHPKCLELQLEYLNLLQSKLSFFSYEKCRDQYGRYLELLKENQGIQPSQRIERQLYAVLRLSSLMRDAGYLELSRSLWQALLEINCVIPANQQLNSENNSTFDQRLSEFEAFWDAEGARIGEDEAFETSDNGSGLGVPNFQALSNRHPAERQSLADNKTSKWLLQERSAKIHSQKPNRTLDEVGDEDDPYRIVLFSDLQPFLIDVPIENHEYLINAFLCFHQLPKMPGHQNLDQLRWWHDPFLVTPKPEVSYPPLALNITNILATTDTLFGALQLSFSTRDDYPIVETSSFINNVLRTLAHKPFTTVDLWEYVVAFQAALDPARARKTAKELLKENPSNLRLYNSYALVELLSGNEEASDKVFSKTFKQIESMNASKNHKDHFLILKIWVWLAILKNDTTSAIERLESSNVSSLFLSDRREIGIRESDPILAAHASEILALRAYLINPSGSNVLSAALHTFSEEATSLKTFQEYQHSAYALELLFQAQATLISNHMKHHGFYSPALIRSALRDSLAWFPNNTMFLNLYAENERRFRIDDRVREIANEILRSADDEAEARQHSVISLCFAIKTEIERGSLLASGSTQHSVRAALERAVGGDWQDSNPSEMSKALYRASPSASSVIWSAFLRWEVEVAGKADHQNIMPGRPEQSKKSKSRSNDSVADNSQNSTKTRLQRAKQVWHRGLDALPWSKDFVLLGIELLQECLSAEELQGYINMMIDKGLRVHHEFENISG